MRFLLAVAHLIDRLTDAFAVVAWCAIAAACVISAGNAAVRYAFDFSSNAFLEIQWYLFAVCVMFGVSQVLRLNEHVRVDVLYAHYAARRKVLVDLFGLACFVLPVAILVFWYALPVLAHMVASGEMSSNAGGLIRWPVMLTIPLGLGLLVLQATAEIIKRVGWLLHAHEMTTVYERPLQ